MSTSDLSTSAESAPTPAPAAAPLKPLLLTPVAPPIPPWLLRVWPRATGPAPRTAVLGTLGSALVAAFLLVWQRPGISWPIVGLIVAAAAWATRRGRSGPDDGVAAAGTSVWRIAWTASALGLLGVAAVRADGQLVTWCVLASIACGSLAVADGRTVRGVGLGAYAVVIGAARAPLWWLRGTRALGSGGRGAVLRVARTAAVCLVLVIVFGALLASADGAFAHIASFVIPSVSAGSVGRAIVALLIVVPVALGLVYLAAGDPPFGALPEPATRTVRRIEWAVPVGVLNAMFAVFVGVQLEFLFGGRERVLRTSGLTYAQYARSGFWQLLVVVALTVVVIGIAVRVAPQTDRVDRLLVRVMLGMLCGLSLVIVASALNRLRVYEDAYGFTRERIAVGVAEVWLGAVFLLIIGAGVTRRAVFVPRTAALTAAVTLMIVAYANPDAFIANHNVDRFQRTGRIDTAYLSQLSADAVPALDRLPEPQRSCAVAPILAGVDAIDANWRSWNLGRDRVRGRRPEYRVC
jgi:hypothetical protein